jgi:hypothetical protein
MLSTVINGPPERSRTRSPLRNGEAVQLCNAGVDGAGSEKAGIEGRKSAIPKAIAVRVRFVNESMLNSTSSGADIGTHFAETTKLHFRSGMPKGRTIGTGEPCAVGGALRRSMRVLDSAHRPIPAGFGANTMPMQCPDCHGTWQRVTMRPVRLGQPIEPYHACLRRDGTGEVRTQAPVRSGDTRILARRS